MEETLIIGNQTLRFRYLEHAECWQAKTLIDHTEVEIEIDPRSQIGGEIEWTHFKDFFVFISKEGRFRKLIEDSMGLINELGKAYFRSLEEVCDYQMQFSHSILYHGRTDGSFIRDGYSWSLVFQYSTRKNGGIYGDEYGIYLVDVENHFIVGARRQQC